MVIPDESLLVVVLEVVEMVFVEVFLICLESLRQVTYQVGYIAPRPCQTERVAGWADSLVRQGLSGSAECRLVPGCKLEAPLGLPSCLLDPHD